MKRDLLKLVLVSSLFLAIFTSKGQDFQFSSINEFQSHLSPSLTGSFNGDLKAMILYRNQWANLDETFNWQALNFEKRLNKGGNVLFTAGVIVVNHQVSAYNRLDGMFLLSSAVQLDDNNVLSAGISAGVINTKIDYASLTWGNQYSDVLGEYDPNLSTGENLETLESQLVFNDGVGLNYSYRSDDFNSFYNRGFKVEVFGSAWHLSRPKLVGFDDQRMEMRFTGGLRSQFSVSNGQSISLLPNIIYSQQGNAHKLYINSYLRFMLKERSRYTQFQKGSAFLLNLGISNYDALVAGIGIEYESFMLLLNYESNISSNLNAKNLQNTFEVGLRFMNPPPARYNMSFF
jgi:type IX secretion system PorP/SprF family membrane protein